MSTSRWKGPKIGRWLTGLFLAFCFACSRPIVFADDVQDIAKADVVRGEVEIQPIDRWIRIVATLLRAGGAGSEADAFALQARAVAGGLRIDTTRPLRATGQFVPKDVARSVSGESTEGGRGNSDEMVIDPESIEILAPVTDQRYEAEKKRVRISKAGVVPVEDTRTPLGEKEFYESRSSGWAVLTRNVARANPAAVDKEAAEFGTGPDQLFEFRLANGVISAALKDRFVAELWRDVQEDLRRNDDEPDEVYALRADIQTAIARMLERITRDLDEFEFTADVVDVADENAYDFSAKLKIRWAEGSPIHGGITAIEPIESRFAAFVKSPAIVRFQCHFRLPRALSRRLARWVEAAGNAGMTVAEAANARQWKPMIAQLSGTLAPAVSSGRIDGFFDLVNVDGNVALNGAITCPAKAVLDEVAPILGRDGKAQIAEVLIDEQRYFRVGQNDDSKDSPFGSRPQLWISASPHVLWFCFGSDSALQSFAKRIASEGETRLAGNPGSAPSSRTSKEDQIASLTIDHRELRRAIGRYKDAPKVAELAKLMETFDDEVGPVAAAVRRGSGSLALELAVPGPIVRESAVAVIRSQSSDR